MSLDSQQPRVSIVLVLFDGHLPYLEKCLHAIAAQTERGLELVVVDNTSTGCRPRDLEAPQYSLTVVRNAVVPSLYCRNNNLGLAHARGRYALVLNLDVKLEPQYLERCTSVLDRDPSAGIAIGRLRRMDSSFRPLPHPVLDSTGLVLSPTVRHFDRDWGRPDVGQRSVPEYVAGATGAAPVFRMDMVGALSLPDGTWFDEDFQMGREDADVSLRAWMAGWRCVYVPDAIAYHIRTGVPGGRRGMPSWFNMHQVKNRYLLRINNLPLGAEVALTPFSLFRDLQAAIYVLAVERSSLEAYRFLWRNRKRLLAKRRYLKGRWRRNWAEVSRLFFAGGSSRPWPDGS